MSYDINKHHDLDWIKNTIYNLVREYECDSLTRDHLELWYSIHIWAFIDKLFDDVKNMEVSRGEPGSIASSNRKIQDRVIGSVAPIVRKATGYKETYATEKEKLEYAVGEIAKFYDKNGAKSLLENGMRLFKCLKEMLNLLAERYPDHLRKLKVFGFLHSGLAMMVLTASKPKGVITRITRGPKLSIPAEVDQFGSKVLPVIVQAFLVKQQIINIKGIMTGSNDQNTEDDDEGEWLETCLLPKETPIIPTTSKSSEKRSKK